MTMKRQTTTIRATGPWLQAIDAWGQSRGMTRHAAILALSSVGLSLLSALEDQRIIVPADVLDNVLEGLRRIEIGNVNDTTEDNNES